MTVHELMMAGALKRLEDQGLTVTRATSTTVYVTVPSGQAGQQLADRCKKLIDTLTGGDFTIKYNETHSPPQNSK